MKTNRSKLANGMIFWILTAAVVVSQPAFAGKGRDGGEPLRIRMAALRDLIESPSVRNTLSTFMARVSYVDWDMPVVSTVKRMVKAGLLEDIKNSPFEFKDECLDSDGKARPATAVRDDRNGPICFGLRELAIQNPTQTELYAIMLHEFAHHFGEQDEDHSLAIELEDLTHSDVERVASAPCGLSGSISDRVADCKAKHKVDDIVMISPSQKPGERGIWIYQNPKTGIFWTTRIPGSFEEYQAAVSLCETFGASSLSGKLGEVSWSLPTKEAMRSEHGRTNRDAYTWQFEDTYFFWTSSTKHGTAEVLDHDGYFYSKSTKAGSRASVACVGKLKKK